MVTTIREKQIFFVALVGIALHSHVGYAQSGMSPPQVALRLRDPDLASPDVPATPPVPTVPPVIVPAEVPTIPLPATEPEKMTLEQLQALAEVCNPTLVQARMEIRAQYGRQVQAGLYPNPSVAYVGEDIGAAGTSGKQGFRLGQEIVTADKLGLAQSAAGHGVAASRHAFDAQWMRVRNSVRQGFYAVLIAQKRVAVHEDLLQVGSQALEITQRLFGAAQITRAEVLQANIEAQRARAGLIIARNQHQAAWRQLAAVVGQPELPLALLDGDPTVSLPGISWDDGLASLLTGSPELAAARARVQQARCNVAAACAERRGNVTVEAGLTYDAAEDKALADVGVAVPLMLFDRNQGGITAAQAELVVATREVERLELALYSQFATIYERFASAQSLVEIYQSDILGGARESLELVEAGYREAEFDYLRLLTAQRTVFHSNLEYLDALDQLWARSIELEGLLLTGGLRKP